VDCPSTWQEWLPLDYLLLECLKTLVLYLKFGNLSGVLGFFVSIGWCFYLLIDPRRLPKWTTRVLFQYLLKNTWLSFSFLPLFHSVFNRAYPARPCLSPCWVSARIFLIFSFLALGVCERIYINWYQSLGYPLVAKLPQNLNTTLWPNT